MTKNGIPIELVAAWMADAKHRDEYTTMYLFQQEVLVALVKQLQLSGHIDTDQLLSHLAAASADPEMGKLAPDLAAVFRARLTQEMKASDE